MFVYSFVDAVYHAEFLNGRGVHYISSQRLTHLVNNVGVHCS